MPKGAASPAVVFKNPSFSEHPFSPFIKRGGRPPRFLNSVAEGSRGTHHAAWRRSAPSFRLQQRQEGIVGRAERKSPALNHPCIINGYGGLPPQSRRFVIRKCLTFGGSGPR